MSVPKRCPLCKQLPLLTIEESFFDDGAKTWSVLHVCPQGFNVSEGPCISRYDAVEAWNLHVEEHPDD